VGERVPSRSRAKRSGDAQSEGAGTVPKGNARGKAVAARLRVTGGAGHECNDERDDLPVVLCTEPVGR